MILGLAKPTLKQLVIPVSLQLLSIGILYYLNKQYGYLYEGIQNYNQVVAITALTHFSLAALVLVLVNSYGQYFNNLLIFQMREKLFNSLQSMKLQIIPTFPQRMQQDVMQYCDTVVEIATALFRAGIKLPLFASVLVQTTSLKIALIIIVAVVAGTVLTKIMSKKLIKVQSTRESAESNLREDIRVNIVSTLDIVRDPFKLFNNQLKKLTMTQGILNQAFVILPFLLLMPLYFSKAITLGAFFQSVNALDKVIESLSILIDKRNVLAVYYTTKTRLEELVSNDNK